MRRSDSAFEAALRRTRARGDSPCDGAGGGWTAHEISTSTDSARASAAADLDGDGDLDVVSGSYDDDTLSWWENDGAGGTWEPHDGDLDALSASYDDDKIAWYVNDGTPANDTTWEIRTISTTAVGAFAVSAADVDGDGDLDVLSGSRNDDKVAWYENDGGAGGWTIHTLTTGADGASSVAAADLDADGDADVVAASTPRAIRARSSPAGRPTCPDGRTAAPQNRLDKSQ